MHVQTDPAGSAGHMKMTQRGDWNSQGVLVFECMQQEAVPNHYPSHPNETMQDQEIACRGRQARQFESDEDLRSKGVCDPQGDAWGA